MFLRRNRRIRRKFELWIDGALFHRHIEWKWRKDFKVISELRERFAIVISLSKEFAIYKIEAARVQPKDFDD